MNPVALGFAWVTADLISERLFTQPDDDPLRVARIAGLLPPCWSKNDALVLFCCENKNDSCWRLVDFYLETFEKNYNPVNFYVD